MYFLYQRIDVENKDILQKNWLVTSAYVCVCIEDRFSKYKSAKRYSRHAVH